MLIGGSFAMLAGASIVGLAVMTALWFAIHRVPVNHKKAGKIAEAIAGKTMEVV